MILRRIVEDPLVRLPEVRYTGVRHATRFGKPAPVERHLIQGEEAIGEQGVVLQVAGKLGDAILPGAQHAAIPDHARAQELGEADRGVTVVVAREDCRGLGQRAENHAVPGRKHLVVQPRRDAARARVIELDAAAVVTSQQLDQRQPHLSGDLGGVTGHIEDGLALEVPPVRYVVVAPEHLRVLCAENASNLVRSPDEELPLNPFAICIRG